MPPTIRPATVDDAEAVAAIYNHYVTTTTVTFEEETVPTEEMRRRIQDVQTKGLPWHIAANEDKVVGYAYGTPWRPRPAYRHTVEITAYVAPDHTGQGIGASLYAKSLAALQRTEAHTLLATIALPNDASVALHEKFGFHKVAHLPEVGRKFGKWIDVGLWHRPVHDF